MKEGALVWDRQKHAYGIMADTVTNPAATGVAVSYFAGQNNSLWGFANMVDLVEMAPQVILPPPPADDV